MPPYRHKLANSPFTLETPARSLTVVHETVSRAMPIKSMKSTELLIMLAGWPV